MPRNDQNGWKTSGHVKLRRGFFDPKHLDRLSVVDRWLFVCLCAQAEWKGVTAGLVMVHSVRQFAAAAGVNRRTAAASLERLEELNYIESTGEQGVYAIPKY